MKFQLLVSVSMKFQLLVSIKISLVMKIIFVPNSAEHEISIAHRNKSMKFQLLIRIKIFLYLRAIEISCSAELGTKIIFITSGPDFTWPSNTD